MIELIANKGRISKLAIMFVMMLISLVQVYGVTTFYVTSDLHYGFEDDEVANRKMICSMKSLAKEQCDGENEKYSLKPDFVLIAGDLIHRGNNVVTVKKELELFAADWGIGSPDAMGCSVYACMGNHDSDSDNFSNNMVSDFIKKSYGDIHYSFDTEDAHVVCIGLPMKDDIK